MEEVLGGVDEFAEQWWTWWSALNPESRERDVYTGRIIPGGDGDDDWTEFHRPGQCGMLTILYTPFWWFGKIVSEEQQVLWTRALEDVGWVLKQLLNDKM